MIDLIADVAGGRAFEIAEHLLRRYRTPGTLFRLFADPAHRDDQVPAEVDSALRRTARAFLAAVALDAVEGRRIRSSEALLAYLRYDMAPLTREHFRVLYLDSNNRLLADRILWIGTVDAVQTHPREIVGAALEIGATAVILVHNHPNGCAVPSQHDLDATRQIIRACTGVGVAVHDHIIVGAGGTSSMRDAGMLS